MLVKIDTKNFMLESEADYLNDVSVTMFTTMEHPSIAEHVTTAERG